MGNKVFVLHWCNQIYVVLKGTKLWAEKKVLLKRRFARKVFLLEGMNSSLLYQGNRYIALVLRTITASQNLLLFITFSFWQKKLSCRKIFGPYAAWKRALKANVSHLCHALVSRRASLLIGIDWSKGNSNFKPGFWRLYIWMCDWCFSKVTVRSKSDHLFRQRTLLMYTLSLS